MAELKAVEIEFIWDEHPEWDSEETYPVPCHDMPHDYRMLVKWLISGGGHELKAEYSGFRMILRPVYGDES